MVFKKWKMWASGRSRAAAYKQSVQEDVVSRAELFKQCGFNYPALLLTYNCKLGAEQDS